MTKQQEQLLLAQTLEARRSVLETIETSVQEAINSLHDRRELLMSEEYYPKVEAFQEVLNLVNSLKTVHFTKGNSQ